MKITVDLRVASDALKEMMDILLRKWENAEGNFHNLFVGAQELPENWVLLL